MGRGWRLRGVDHFHRHELMQQGRLAWGRRAVGMGWLEGRGRLGWRGQRCCHRRGLRSGAEGRGPWACPALVWGRLFRDHPGGVREDGVSQLGLAPDELLGALLVAHDELTHGVLEGVDCGRLDLRARTTQKESREGGGRMRA